MDITIVGAGRIGGNIARQLGRAGHSLTLTFARDTAAQQALAEEVGAGVAAPAAAALDNPSRISLDPKGDRVGHVTCNDVGHGVIGEDPVHPAEQPTPATARGDSRVRLRHPAGDHRLPLLRRSALSPSSGGCRASFRSARGAAAWLRLLRARG